MLLVLQKSRWAHFAVFFASNSLYAFAKKELTLISRRWKWKTSV